MKIILDRHYCDASLSFCARCSAAFSATPSARIDPVWSP
jgi:hypothetical protein